MANSGQCLRLLVFEDELDFIKSHNICDDVTERALFHSLQTCVEISMDIVAMLTKDAGLVVGGDYTNIEKLSKEHILRTDEKETLNGYTGLRNDISIGTIALIRDASRRVWRGLINSTLLLQNPVSIYESISTKQT